MNNKYEQYAVAVVYIVSVLALLAAAVAIENLRCESFGCMGIGVAWFAWAVSFFVVLGIGLFARSKLLSATGLVKVARAAVWLQLILGFALIIIWAAKSAPSLFH